MVKQASVLADLQHLLGAENVYLPAEGSAVDGSLPQAVAMPASYEEVTAVMAFASGRGLGVIPWGAGTMMGLGNLPRRYDIALSLGRLNAVVEHEPADLTVTCQAGISLGRLADLMAASGQMVPLDPALPHDATVGGALAANASGPYRHSLGTARDFTIGMRVVTADGRITRAGGKVVKNVAGYDLCKLYIGSLGTLCVIVEATFKVLPLPLARRSVRLSFPSATAACQLARDARRRGLSVAAAVLVGAARRWHLLLELGGTPLAVERSHKEASAMARDAGGRVVRRGPAPEPPRMSGSGILCRFGVLPTRLPDLLAGLQRAGLDSLTAYPAAGVLYVALPPEAATADAVRRMESAAYDQQATMVIESCPEALKREFDVFGEPPGSFGLMRRIKEQFDPAGVLNPGRFLGRL